MRIKYFKLILIALSIIGSSINSVGQIFPDLLGEELVQQIQQQYTPAYVLSETQAKDTLYARVFIEGDTVRCIYSGLPRMLPANVDPSQYLYGNGTETNSINLEHSWPQAKGAGKGSKGNSNMHHLFPSRTEINSDRADFPFSNIPDPSTEKWYFLFDEMSAIPQANIDHYSEFHTGTFEPRESVKGDIARAMFYFWTIYRNDAKAADATYFNSQRTALCAWHQQDPADNFERVRNARIANYQDGKTNPFIEDCTLALRAYCPGIEGCNTVSIQEQETSPHVIQYDFQNRQFRIISKESAIWSVYALNIQGQIVLSDEIDANQWSNPINLSSGLYFFAAKSGTNNILVKIFVE